MKTIILKAAAKINLSLIIKGRMEDGYHELDTIMCPVELSDTLIIRRRQDKLITCSGLNIPNNLNTAYKAARLLMEEFDTDGVDIMISKDIPISAGLGGSSSDAAAVMYAFSKLYYIDIDKIKFMSREIGSDIPFLLQVSSGAMRARGRGDILTEEELEPIYAVIAKPEGGVETAKAYKLYDEMSIMPSVGDNIELISALKQGKSPAPYLINDLYLPATAINSEIEPLYNLMMSISNGNSIMSGSGSAVLALLKDYKEAETVYNRIPDKYYKVITKTKKSAIEELD